MDCVRAVNISLDINSVLANMVNCDFIYLPIQSKLKNILLETTQQEAHHSC